MQAAKDWSFFEHLFKQNYSILRSYALRYIGDEAVAEDIVQDVFFDLWQNKEKIDFEQPIRPYLFKATFNKCLNHIKSKYVRSKVSIDENIDLNIEYYIRSQATYQEDSLLLQDINKEIKHVVDSLPEQCRKIFLLSRSLDLTNKEIAEQLGISVKAVEKQITKALAALRSHFKTIGLSLAIMLYL